MFTFAILATVRMLSLLCCNHLNKFPAHCLSSPDHSDIQFGAASHQQQGFPTYSHALHLRDHPGSSLHPRCKLGSHDRYCYLRRCIHRPHQTHQRLWIRRRHCYVHDHLSYCHPNTIYQEIECPHFCWIFHYFRLLGW